jgi:serine/threonine protein kinase/tetratricopeptide (TPR) repeat protein
MTAAASGGTWEQAASPPAARLARRFESAWRAAADPPDLDGFLPDDPGERAGARLALLRTELTLRWEAGERVSVEEYRERYQDLDDEAFAALAYEEYCLREEGLEAPRPEEYYARFPEQAERLGRIFEVHGLVGAANTAIFEACDPSNVPFPNAGETVNGFHLVEEIGRGTFARVFRALERALADRPVALKVARTGSREPQTLARLQHTHIVPVYSYLTDRQSGLHLLCMPYYGRVTLAGLLADPQVRVARSGSELVAALARLDPGSTPLSVRPAARQALAARTYARAIAWWGARLAEALQHAHDHGVLHRDVKPSNVLVTADGMPMLLDFNLAWENCLRDVEAEPSTLGGTVAYMSPEQLEALAEGTGEYLDGRADLYSLGVVLYEALGTRPFSLPAGARSLRDALLCAAEQRKTAPPRLRDRYPEVPAELEAVIRKCLAPHRADRYATAAKLAVDLQAVADEEPLRHAREPVRSGTLRWARRNRRRLSVAIPVALALGLYVYADTAGREARRTRRSAVQKWISDAKHSLTEGKLPLALDQFEQAKLLAKGDPDLAPFYVEARNQYEQTRQKREIRQKVDQLKARSDQMRFQLLGFRQSPGAALPDVETALRPFYVFEFKGPDWSRLAELALLDDIRRRDLIDEVNDLLFLWAVSLERTGSNRTDSSERGLKICDRALAFADTPGPWRVLRDHFAAKASGQAPRADSSGCDRSKTSAHAAFQWGVLANLRGDRAAAVAWLEQAARLEPYRYWHQFYLAFNLDRLGKSVQALQHYEAAIALWPEASWAYEARGRLHLTRGEWVQALENLSRAVELRGAKRTDEMAAARRGARAGLECDPDAARLFLARAQAFEALKRWRSASSDLESALKWAGHDRQLIAEINHVYCRCRPLCLKPESASID